MPQSRFYTIIVFMIAVNLVTIVVAPMNIFPSSEAGTKAEFTFFAIEPNEDGGTIQITSPGLDPITISGILAVAGSIFTGVFISAALTIFLSTFSIYYFSVFRGTLDMLGLDPSTGMGMIIFIMTGITLMATLIYMLSGRRL